MRTRGWMIAFVAIATTLILTGVRGLRALAPEAASLPRPMPATAELPPGTKLLHGRQDVKAVAITFDDGPHPGYTQRLLEVLADHQARATFFVVGKMAAKYPELVMEERAEGHQIANHSYSHPDLSRLSRTAARAEWARCNELLRLLTGDDTRFCRPPTGRYNRATIAAAGDEGMSMVLWSRYPADISEPGVSTLVARTLHDVHGGDIILLHDGIRQTIDALPRIITGLRAQGFELRTVEELAAAVASSPAPAGLSARETPSRPRIARARGRLG